MVELVKTIATSLVDHPELVEVTEKENKGYTIVIQLKVAEDDMGKVIGRQGRIAKALRAVVKAASVRVNKKVIVEIVS
ncbi:MAG: KH domain-containing protein [Clostridia bacterium]|nr:KH domain-containing protein [Clostridia bacterium]